MSTCDRVVVIDFGRVIASGTPDGDPRRPGRPRRLPRPRRRRGRRGRRRRRGGADVTETLIEAQGLSAGYGKMAVVRDIDLHVDAGEVVALLGANGAGKTTTLLTLAGELSPAGRRGPLPRASRRKAPMHVRCRNGLGYLTEERSVIMDMSVADNLKLAAVAPDGGLRATSRPSSGSWIAGPGSARAASSRCSRWPGPSAASRRCCSPTSCRSGWPRSSSPTCSRRSATPPTSGASACSSSSSTSARRSRSPTGST